MRRLLGRGRSGGFGRPDRPGRLPPGLRDVAAFLLVIAVFGCTDSADEEPDGFTMLVEPIAKSAEPDPALWQTPVDDPALEAGRVVWTGTCIDCHSTGLGGAPLIGSESLWAPRIAQGLDVLVEHATQGFYGKVGEMPARGGNPELSDEDVRAAVRFMISRAGVVVPRGS